MTKPEETRLQNLASKKLTTVLTGTETKHLERLLLKKKGENASKVIMLMEE